MIRSMKESDLDRVMDIWLEANLQGHSFIPDTYWLDHLSMVRGLLPQAEVWVYEKEGAIDGFIGVAKRAYIAGLFVTPDRQSSGVGGALLEWCQARYPGLSLNVYVDNDRAVQFYLKNGFIPSEELKNEDTGYREYVMSWNQARQ